jgi:hypothetical protein
MNMKFAELHTALFLAGINCGLKLDPTRRAGLKLSFDDKVNMLVVTLNNEKALIPISNVASMQPGDPKVAKPVVAIVGPIKAQASVPQGLKNE